MNWIVIIIVFILGIALIAFTIIQNQKDEKEFEHDLNNENDIVIKQNEDIEI